MTPSNRKAFEDWLPKWWDDEWLKEYTPREVAEAAFLAGAAHGGREMREVHIRAFARWYRDYTALSYAEGVEIAAEMFNTPEDQPDEW